MATLHQYKLQIVLYYLKKHNWNRTKAALELDISLRATRNYIAQLKKIGFDVPFPSRIPRKPCPMCGYYKLQNNVGQWICYACKYVDKKEDAECTK